MSTPPLNYHRPDAPRPSRWTAAAFALAVVGAGLPAMALPAVVRAVLASAVWSPVRLAVVGYAAVGSAALLCGQWCASVALRRTRADRRLALAAYGLNAALLVAAVVAYELAGGFADGGWAARWGWLAVFAVCGLGLRPGASGGTPPRRHRNG